jgi:hypothetical protein
MSVYLILSVLAIQLSFHVEHSFKRNTAEQQLSGMANWLPGDTWLLTQWL